MVDGFHPARPVPTGDNINSLSGLSLATVINLSIPDFNSTSVILEPVNFFVGSAYDCPCKPSP